MTWGIWHVFPVNCLLPPLRFLELGRGNFLLVTKSGGVLFQ